jgi:hypothetical protein
MDGGCMNYMRESCIYKVTCKAYSKTSYTCNHMGGTYCGTFKAKERARGIEL